MPGNIVKKNAHRLRINAILSGAQVIVGAAVLFVLFRFIVQSLGTEAIGLWSLVMAIVAAVRMGELGLGASSIRFVPKHLARGDLNEAAAAVSTATISVATLVPVLCVMLWPLMNWGLSFFVDSSEELVRALALLPYAVISLWLSAVSNSVTTALVGCHRADLSSLLQMAGQLLWLIAGLLLVPRMGVEGLALGQAVQYLFIAVVGWLLLGRELLGYCFWLPTWSFERLKEMWRYGVTQQFISLAALLGEPLAKALMAHFGNLSLLGIFEMANRLVSQVRMLMVNANLVVVPYYASLAESGSEGLARAYTQNVRILTLLGIIVFSFLAIGLPIIGIVWLGREEPWFLVFGLLMCFGWYINVLGAPAFFFNAGAGRLGVNLVTQFVQSIVMILVGIIAGSLFGVMGAALAWPIGLFAGTAVILVLHSRSENISILKAFGSFAVATMVWGVAVTIVCLYIYQLLSPVYELYFICAVTAGTGLAGWLVFFVFVRQARGLFQHVAVVRATSIRKDGLGSV